MTGAREKNGDGDLLIHLASRIDGGAPLAVIEALHTAFADGVRQPDAKGNVTLHLALEHKSPRDVLFFVLRAYPEACMVRGEGGRIPLHRAASYQAPLEIVEEMLSIYKKGAEDKNKSGYLALHMAAAYKASIEVVIAILAAYPAGECMLLVID